ncbi:Dabb family protein [Nevskia soli]|jgi:outer membrane protein W|uniref:Dabb family protein n=1 Tax=Nevskia soli TaxID=418856 RepID=UPI0015D959D3|nr:Dabb family protein [Nevskia soli]
MPNLTRRSLLQKSSIAPAAALASAALPQSAAAQDAGDTVFHVFAFRWKPGTTEAQKARAAKDIAAFQGVVTGLLQTHVGNNFSPRGNGYTFGGIMHFSNKAALEAYVKHPAHQALLKWLVPLIEAVELDIHA